MFYLGFRADVLVYGIMPWWWEKMGGNQGSLSGIPLPAALDPASVAKGSIQLSLVFSTPTPIFLPLFPLCLTRTEKLQWLLSYIAENSGNTERMGILMTQQRGYNDRMEGEMMGMYVVWMCPPHPEIPMLKLNLQCVSNKAIGFRRAGSSWMRLATSETGRQPERLKATLLYLFLLPTIWEHCIMSPIGMDVTREATCWHFGLGLPSL